MSTSSTTAAVSSPAPQATWSNSPLSELPDSYGADKEEKASKIPCVSSASTLAGSFGSPSEESDSSDADWQSAGGSPKTAAEDATATEMSPRSGNEAVLAVEFLELAGLPSADGEIYRCVLKAVRMLLSCGFQIEDVCMVLTFASVYFLDITKKCPVKGMGEGEAANILMLLMYLAHSYVQDEHCPLRVWHKHLFRDYCQMPTLDRALMCLMKMRGYLLRVEEAEVQWRHERLVASSRT